MMYLVFITADGPALISFEESHLLYEINRNKKYV